MGNNVDAKHLKDAFLAGANNLDAKKEWINELNVFPVPDGDTGTNMTMTIMSAARDVAGIADPTMELIARAMSSGSLRGARGNSGVILSQLIRGFTKEIKTVTEIDCISLARAFNRATETAYKAVMKPKEGTILTVAKGMSDKAVELSAACDDPVELLEKVVAYGDEVLARTPELLPVLKEAGVVDSGGQGLMVVMKGALASLKGEEVTLDIAGAELAGAAAPKTKAEISTADIKFGYCTEFIVNTEKPFTEEDERSFKAFLESIGDSIVCVADEDMVKVHVHTNHPGQAFEKGLTYGSLSRMKVDNMREEHEERLIKDASKIAAMEKLNEDKKPAEPQKEFGFIAISAGDGLTEIFRGIGVDYIIEGGQTMNPSTEDILNAAEKVNAKHIFVLPNNKNIILAANQARDLIEDKDIHVIPSKTIPQGITAMISFSPELSPEDNEAAMTEALGAVASGQVTYAVRNTTIEGREITEGDIMGLGDHGLLSVEKTVEAATEKALDEMVGEDSEIVTLYYGEDVKEAEAEALAAAVQEQHPSVEVELQYGGQPIYYYFLSVE